MKPEPLQQGRYNGLTTGEPSLPSEAYFSEPAFRRDLETIWYREWVLVCRDGEIATSGSYRVVTLGDQQIVVLRNEAGGLSAFHNTCRHRGSQLCTGEKGRLKGRLITCPYHAWSYSMTGDLIRVPSKSLPEGFDRKDYPLYRVSVQSWRGFVFINLDPSPASNVAETFDAGSASLANWPLENLVTGHSMTRVVACNWKVFWENFNECLHCPTVHRHLSELVPIYGRGLMARHDDPDWALHADNDEPRFSGRLRDGAETWSGDGRALEVRFPDLTEAERAAGQNYATHLPSMFIVGHVDYVRTVRMRPLGPETTELTAEWLFLPEALEAPREEIDNIVAFATEVLEEDAAVCEINQKGLRARPHGHGILMPEEYDLHRFHGWVRERHARA